MRYRMELHLILEKDVQKYLMLNVQMRVEFAFMERLLINKFKFVGTIERKIAILSFNKNY